MAKTFSKAELEARYLKEANTIARRISCRLSDLLKHLDSGVEVIKEDEFNLFTIVLRHPDLMDDCQANSDLSEMVSLAKESDLVVSVKKCKSPNRPTFTDLYNGLFLPSIYIIVEMK